MAETTSERPTLLLLHAFPLNGSMWEPLRRELQAHADVLTPDLPGFGAAPGLDEESFTMEQAARHVEGLLDAHDIRRCVLGGLSMGGYIALECWRLFPERISGMILADTKATPDDEEGRRVRYAAAERIGRGEYAEYVEEQLERLLSEKARDERPELVDRVRGMMLATIPESAVAGLLGMASRRDSTELLATIDVPVALIFGERDAVTKLEEGRRMAEAIPEATLTTIAGAGHLSALENPEEFARAVTEAMMNVAR